ncbi:hypothetical protein BSL78_07842 [Apostichopus japonicus]|uniref:Uncharacterized protein n=1 Tax=Stichopus japonicus TaxID=307972 RepID=A0A2G8L4R4_STIJA|nr:hypothetical protein BSL78_07842 [Apostichopus japonicus]
MIEVQMRCITHRLTSGTELLEKGFHSSNQLDRLNDLLKDQPQTVALRQANFQRIPALGVVQNPNVDRIAREEGALPEYLEETEYKEKHHGFVPGAYDNRSLLVDANRIAIKNMEHQEFINLKGHDFRLYHKERSPLHKPLLKPLSQAEKANNLFKRVPTPPEDTKPKNGPVKEMYILPISLVYSKDTMMNSYPNQQSKLFI